MMNHFCPPMKQVSHTSQWGWSCVRIETSASGREEYQVSGQPLAFSIILSIAEAAGAGQVLHEPLTLDKHFSESSFVGCDHVTECSMSVGGQDHVYLRASCIGDALIRRYPCGKFNPTPDRGSGPDCQSSWRQCGECDRRDPTDGWGIWREREPAAHFAMLAALGAHVTGRPVKVRLDRDDDMRVTERGTISW